VDLVNQKILRLNTVCYSNVYISINNSIIKAKGQLFFQKDSNIRIKIGHKLFGEEMDLGSNKEFFWFWSKRMNPCALYYSKHEDLNKTLLKTPLNPDWLIESFGFKPIDKKNITFLQIGKNLGVKQSRISTNGQNVYIVTLIDKDRNNVIGRYLYDCYDHILASVEFKDFRYIDTLEVPILMTVHWHEENVFMDWSVEEIEINKSLSPEIWDMPNYEPSIDMAAY
jgi:hypothetical protein